MAATGQMRMTLGQNQIEKALRIITYIKKGGFAGPFRVYEGGTWSHTLSEIKRGGVGTPFCKSAKKRDSRVWGIYAVLVIICVC